MIQVNILFAIMAVQEVVFFVPIAKRLRDALGLNIAFLTFHEAGDDILEREGITYFSLHKIKRSLKREGRYRAEEGSTMQSESGIDMEHIIFHEMHTSRRPRKDLIAKAGNYRLIFSDILEKNKVGCIVQELGGFIAPLTLYYVSRLQKVDHVFIEPAMFKKRVVFTLNNLYANIGNYGSSEVQPSDELQQLMDEYMTRKTVVIPKKDRHFFQDMTFKRMYSMDNFRRLSRKLYHKYLLRREEEYNWIMRYVNMHFIKAIRRKLLNLYYTDPVKGEKYIYYPFHVPLDVQLTARCPEFFDQEALIGKVAKAIPSDHKLYVKEHPAAIGGHSLAKLKEALKNNSNIRLLHPRHNSYDLIKHAACIVTVNSKVGFEAIMQGKPVVVLGKTFYRGKGVTIDVDRTDDMSKAITTALGTKADIAEREFFLNSAFQWTYKGELYENSTENVDNFYLSLASFLTTSGMLQEKKALFENPVS